MSDETAKLTREERLAAKLRENLRRRKVQARAIGTSEAPQSGDSRGAGLSKSGAES